ncbi:hypothetical protein [Sphingomonas sp. CROZ-RG-20F-R02-07]|jgi:hypothetical protein|uniref:hypothetical protein n=1 Tax=Sphingomonas sp. CROZ-RG-20F-R02-07 TaxID=2914832 RepID=UPI001F593603|nr:hypothetical protein [Sphingomonas sp. CROZ-RG-20F-R02-07]
MLNVIPVAVPLVFTAGAIILFARRRVPLSYVFLALGLGMFSLVAWPFWPVDAKGEHHAIVLSRAGPLGAKAYRSAMSDGRITRDELRTIREAAGQDLDTEYGLSTPNNRN